MSKQTITCSNCGFEEELEKAEVTERAAAEGGFTCSQCNMGIDLPVDEAAAPEDAATAKSSDATASADEAAADEHAESKADTAKAAAARAAELAKVHARKAFEAGREDPVFICTWLDAFVKKLSGWLSPETFDDISSKSVRFGHYAILIYILFVLLMGVVTGVRSLSLIPVFSAFGTALLLIVAQYLAVKGFQLLGGLVERNPSRLASPFIAEVFAGLGVMLVVCGTFSFILAVLKLEGFFHLSYALVMLVVGFFSAVTFTQYEKRLNASVDASLTTGRQCVGCLALLAKTLVTIVPFIFGFGVIITALSTIWPLVNILIHGSGNIPQAYIAVHRFGQTNLLDCQMFMVAVFAASPMLIYFATLLNYLVIDLIKAVLGNSAAAVEKPAAKGGKK